MTILRGNYDDYMHQNGVESVKRKRNIKEKNLNIHTNSSNYRMQED